MKRNHIGDGRTLSDESIFVIPSGSRRPHRCTACGGSVPCPRHPKQPRKKKAVAPEATIDSGGDGRAE
jgi:hypothetical protein